MSIPWTARRSNQSILKEISPEYSLKELMLKLKLQYFGRLMQRTDSLAKTLMVGKIEGRITTKRFPWAVGGGNWELLRPCRFENMILATFSMFCMCVQLVAQLCLSLRELLACRLPFPVPGDRICLSCISCIGRQILYH